MAVANNDSDANDDANDDADDVGRAAAAVVTVVLGW